MIDIKIGNVWKPRFGQWISTEDAMPNPDKDVLLWVEEYDSMSRQTEGTVYRGFYDGETWGTNYCYGCKMLFAVAKEMPYRVIFTVRYWMPLPEGPEED